MDPSARSRLVTLSPQEHDKPADSKARFFRGGA